MDAERLWRYPSASEPGVTRTVRLVNSVFVCDCPARRRCKHIEAAEAEIAGVELGYDPFSFDTDEPPKLYTAPYWNWRNEMGVPCRITIGSPPEDFPGECDDGLPWCLAPWPPLFQMMGKEFEQAYRAKLDQIGVDRIRASIAQVARRQPGRPLTCLCWEPVWIRPARACHRRVFAEWWGENTGEKVNERPPRSRGSSAQPIPTHPPPLRGIPGGLTQSPSSSGHPHQQPTKKEET